MTCELVIIIYLSKSYQEDYSTGVFYSISVFWINILLPYWYKSQDSLSDLVLANIVNFFNTLLLKVTEVCPLYFQLIGHPCRNTQYPVTDILVSLSPVQSESENKSDLSMSY